MEEKRLRCSEGEGLRWIGRGRGKRKGIFKQGHSTNRNLIFKFQKREYMGKYIG